MNLPGIGVLQAKFIDTQSGRHAHEDYFLGIMDKGAEAFEL